MVIPYEEFVALQELLEDMEDLRDLRAAKAEDAGNPGISLEDAKKELLK
ncbi:MAG: type II toxin-antitoxin system Phd/YefM family antitoxin [Nitrospinae bacterium]|nr:type II toxin-antitoxin system Phd/YefM family antitoxin [Nitrospinota bacterium]